MASYLLIRHKVKDYKAWKALYDAHHAMRAGAGLTEKYLLRNADDPNEVIGLYEARDLDRARAFTQSEDLREKMQQAGVADKPDVYFLSS